MRGSSGSAGFGCCGFVPATGPRHRRGNGGLPIRCRHDRGEGLIAGDGVARCGFAAGRARIVARAGVAQKMPAARSVRIACAPRPAGRCHDNAIHRTRRQAKLAAGAKRRDDGMHAFGSADNRIHGTGLDAKRAADAPRFIDARIQERTRLAERGVERQQSPPGNGGEQCNDRRATWRTTIDRFSGCDRFGVRPASRMTAAAALRLRQRVIDTIDKLRLGSKRAVHHRILARRAGVRSDRKGLVLARDIAVNGRFVVSGYITHVSSGDLNDR